LTNLSPQAVGRRQGENGTISSRLPNRDAREHPRTEEACPGSENGGFTFSLCLWSFLRKADIMPEFMTEWWFIGLMAVILVALIGVLLFLRSRRPEE
jgi:uncharacterized membrane protein